MDPLMSPTEFHDHQRRALRDIERHEREALRLQSATMQAAEYERTKEMRDKLFDAHLTPEEPCDLIFQVELINTIPYIIGALLGLVVFVSVAVYVVKSGAWRMPETVLTFVAPANTSHGRK